MEWLWVGVWTCLLGQRHREGGELLWALGSRVSGELGGSKRGWLPILPTLEAPVESPASNICRGMAGAGKCRPGVVLPGHSGGCP